jgi:hypothetical protein
MYSVGVESLERYVESTNGESEEKLKLNKRKVLKWWIILSLPIGIIVGKFLKFGEQVMYMGWEEQNDPS